jgi:tetratricopeptide (TPR) repeat protein
MKRRLISLLVIFAVASLVTAQGTSSLQGRVIAPNGMQPANSVRVKLILNGRPIQETFTDLSGRFHFPGLKGGTYELRAEGDSQTFLTTSVYTEIAGSSPFATQDIQLRPVPGKPPAQTGVVNAFAQNVPRAALQAMERATKLTGQGKTDEAVAQLQEAVKLFPEYFEAHLQLGNIFLKDGKFEQAIAELDKAREVNPNDERAYQSFGLLLLKQKNFAVAVAVFDEAARLNPENPTNPLMSATALIHQASSLSESSGGGRARLLERAALNLSQAAKLSGNKVKADALTLATFYEMKGEPGRAADELEAYLQKSEMKNAAPLQEEIRRLRAKSKETKSPPE